MTRAPSISSLIHSTRAIFREEYIFNDRCASTWPSLLGLPPFNNDDKILPFFLVVSCSRCTPTSVMRASVPSHSLARTLINKFGKQAFVSRELEKSPIFHQVHYISRCFRSHSSSAVTFYFATSSMLSSHTGIIGSILSEAFHEFICLFVSIWWSWYF